MVPGGAIVSLGRKRTPLAGVVPTRAGTAHTAKGLSRPAHLPQHTSLRTGAGCPGEQRFMPKRQSTAGQKTRRRQHDTGENYTTALRHTDSPVYALALALRAAGLAVEAADLTALLAE